MSASAPKSPEHAALGQAVRELRERAGLTQQALGDRAGFDRTYVGGVERGERNLSFASLVKLARALDARPSELLARAEAAAAS